MAVQRFEITSREQFAGGATFGDAGAYERIDGLLHVSVDPANPANSAIVDLDVAQRGGDGLVHFVSDVCVLQPLDSFRGNGSLLVELPNRGRKLLPRIVNRAQAEVPPTRNIPVGDGFLFRRGWTVCWIGWQWDVVRSDALMGQVPPVSAVSGQTVVRFQPSVAHQSHLLADRIHQPYPAADLSEPGATLTVRDTADSEPTVVPRGAWRFAREEGAGVEPHPEYIFLEAGFEPGRIYELVYSTTHAPLVGCSLLAVREIASFLRYEERDNPSAGRIQRAYAFGMSQTGRMLRHFLYLGLNVDESERQAYDGIVPHVGGARRGEFNHRFGQPSVQGTPGFGHMPPFDDAGLLKRQRFIGCVPKVVQTNTSAEYWRGDCSLIHIDKSGADDLESEPSTRVYHFAGTQHGPGSVPLTRDNPNDGARGRYGFNAVDYSPLMRAVLVNLDCWVRDGVEPPPSRHPRLSDGTAVTRDSVLERFARFPGIHLPDPQCLPLIREIDLGERADAGIGQYPAREGMPSPAFVSAVDSDGNEVAGIRLPDISVPIATYTGWNPRAPETGAPYQVMPMQGSTFFLAPNTEDAQATGDPREPISLRYSDRGAYLRTVEAAARQLVTEGYLLIEDVPLVIGDAATRYDAAIVSYAAFQTP